MYPSVLLTHAGMNGKIGRKLPREDMMGGTNDVILLVQGNSSQSNYGTRIVEYSEVNTISCVEI